MKKIKIIQLTVAGVTIATLTGDNGIITKAAEAAFRTEMAQIKEQVELREIQAEMDGVTIQERFTKVSLEDLKKYDADLKKEIVYWGQYDIGVNEITKEYAKNNWRDILTEERLSNLYIVDKETAGGKEKTYLYDVKEQIVYKIPITKIGKYGVHSVEELNDCRGESNDNIISDDSKMVTVDGVSYYEPNLAGFNLDKTSIVYYEVSENIKESTTLTAKEYISRGKPRTIEKEGKTYEFYNYKTQKWVNILVENSGMQSYWTWIPRYAYSVTANETAIIFIDLNNKPLDGSTLPSNYIVHPSFENDKKGIWASKYEPVEK